MKVIAGLLVMIAVAAWCLALCYMFKTVARRKPEIRLWRDAPALNPFNHLLVSANLTEEGLRFRRRFAISLAAFVISILIALGIGAATGMLR